MYVDESRTTVNGKTYYRALLRECYRQDGQVKHRTIANISRCSRAEITAIKLALKHKDDLSELIRIGQDVTEGQGPSVGAVWLLYDLARRFGIEEALGRTRAGRLALWQVIARVIEQGSRLSAVRLAGRHACCDVLGLDAFNEEDLYANLDWLCEHQSRIEDHLFRGRYPSGGPGLFLYDVTSSYLEGQCNELGFFGYNRDGKRGKKQIVIGLLCDGQGTGLSIQAFEGNTQDPQTFGSQIHKAAERFGGGPVTFVGDRGMIKGQQIQDLVAHEFHYITAITKPQIETLLAQGVFQMELFDQDLAEVVTQEGPRYVLRRNPIRVQEIRTSRADKFQRLLAQVSQANTYLSEHPRAKVATALAKLRVWAQCRKIAGWVTLATADRVISVAKNTEALGEAERLDGCYVIRTDLTAADADKETVHARYKDLSKVESGFKTCKTEHLEMRPIHVRLASRTRGHALVVMLAYRLTQELSRLWRDLDLTVAEGIRELAGLCAVELRIKGIGQGYRIPDPGEWPARLLNAAQVRMPKALPSRGVIVTTKRKLTERRVSR